MTDLALDTMPQPRRGRGRPRKQAAAKRPAYRPPIAFMEHHARFGVVLSSWLAASGMKETKAINLAAMIADPAARFEQVPKAAWDRALRDLAADNPGLAGNVMIAMTKSTKMLVASAARSIRRCATRLESDVAANDWAITSAKSIGLLHAIDGRVGWLARMRLAILGWPVWLIDRVSPNT